MLDHHGYQLVFISIDYHQVTKVNMGKKSGVVCMRSIMAAILQTSGPLSTCEAIRSTWKFLAGINVQQFQDAAIELEKVNLGAFVSISNQTGRATRVFIKKKPKEVCLGLEANPDLCDLDDYAARYSRRPPKVINWHVRSKVVEFGLVAKGQLI